MAAQQKDDADSNFGFALAVVREETSWKVTQLGDGALAGIATAESELRKLRAAGASFALINVDDEFFIILRPAPSGRRLLLSDATAAVEYEIAAEVLDSLGVTVPDLDPDELADVDPWEEGDLAILADLGLDEQSLGVIVGDVDLYADEQLGLVAARLGFADEYARVLDTIER